MRKTLEENNNKRHGRSVIVQLTARDQAILEMVHRYAGCTTEQVQARFFPTPGARSACYARLARLRNAGLLASMRLPSQSGVGSGRAFLTLGRLGHGVVAARLGVAERDVRLAHYARAPLFLAHHLAIGAFRLALELASERDARLVLQEWVPEHELKRAPLSVASRAPGPSVPLVPDGQFTLRHSGGAEQTFLLEMDMGTVSPKRLRAKLRAYLSRERRELTPILFVVPQRLRQAAIVTWAIEEAAALAADPTIVWVTTQERISPSSILWQPIWQVTGGPGALALSGSTAEVGQRTMPAAGSLALTGGGTP